LYSRIAFGKGFARLERVDSSNGLRIENPRYGRLEICATDSARAPTFLLAPGGRGAREADQNVGAPARHPQNVVAADGRRLKLPGNPSYPTSDAKVSREEHGRDFWFPVAIVLLAEAIAILAFYNLEWSWPRQMHVQWLQTTLHALGCHVEAADTLLTVNGHHFQIDPDCTYVDLIICSLPLLWRVRRRFAANLAVLAAFAAAVLAINLGRVLYGVYAYSHGVSMFWAHDLVDYVLWYPTMGIVAFLWVRSLGTLVNNVPPRSRSSRGNEALTEKSAIRNPHSAIDRRRPMPAATVLKREAKA
jgi:exosortase/archaeosortase family protein